MPHEEPLTPEQRAAAVAAAVACSNRRTRRQGGGFRDGSIRMDGVFLIEGVPKHARARIELRGDVVHTTYSRVRHYHPDGGNRHRRSLPVRRHSTVRATRPRDRRGRSSRTSRGSPVPLADDDDSEHVADHLRGSA